MPVHDVQSGELQYIVGPEFESWSRHIPVFLSLPLIPVEQLSVTEKCINA